VRISQPKFSERTIVTLAPSQVTYRTRVPQGERYVRVFLTDPTNPRIQAWTESYTEGHQVSPLSLSLGGCLQFVFDSFIRLGKPIPDKLWSIDLSPVLQGRMVPSKASPSISQNGNRSDSSRSVDSVDNGASGSQPKD
jgi:hypothetical protein